MKKLISLLTALLLMASACALASSSISAGDVTVPEVSFPNASGDAGSGIVSSSQSGSAQSSDKNTDASGMMGMADVLSALKGDEITAYEAVEKTADAAADLANFHLTLNVLNPEMPFYALLEEIAAHVQEAPISAYLGEEAMAAALPLLPEDCDPAALVLDELYEMVVSGYDAAYGDIDAAFEFVTEYPEDTVLLAAAGVLPGANDAGDAAVLWLPMQAGVSEGQVCIRLPQQVLETANAGENTIAFALLRLEAGEDAQAE